MNPDPLSTWLGFLLTPAAPKTAMSPMELDGYLTGILVSPDLLLPSLWLDGIWGEDEPVFDDQEQLQAVISAVMDRYNSIIAALDGGFKKLEAKEPTDYRPSQRFPPRQNPKRHRPIWPVPRGNVGRKCYWTE